MQHVSPVVRSVEAVPVEFDDHGAGGDAMSASNHVNRFAVLDRRDEVRLGDRWYVGHEDAEACQPDRRGVHRHVESSGNTLDRLLGLHAAVSALSVGGCRRVAPSYFHGPCQAALSRASSAAQRVLLPNSATIS